MNTDLVQSLMATATKPTSGNNAAPKRDATTPVSHQDAVSPAKEPQIVPPTQKVQETVAAVAAQIESYLRSVGRQVHFSIDSTSGDTIISVRDANTGDLIRQIPSEEALRLREALRTRQSTLVDVLA
jgi:flagellar protein FlaG